ncbi:hypothetical protein [Paraburkholderia unamae]|uniref:Uncharacterized protein n=1 Tax=Paraburkholderia unamae TaxID=219649 RepID=A0ACC6RZB3_9BURK
MASSTGPDDASDQHPWGPEGRPHAERIRADLSACHELISYAARNGKEIKQADIQAFAAAEAAYHDQSLTPECEGSFYEAMSRIACCVAPVTVETLDPRNQIKLKHALKIYGRLTAAMAVIVILLSSSLLTITRLSDEITKIVNENDTAARTLHDELQGYVLAMLDSKSAMPGMHNLLVNGPSSVELKEHLQAFARNNRQLYSDIKYLNNLWRTLSGIGWLIFAQQFGPDVRGRNPYASGCNANQYTRSYVIIDPNPMMYENPDSKAQIYPLNMKVNPTSTRYPFYSVEKPYTIPWMCDPDSTRAALEIRLPLLRVGSADVQDQLELPLPEFDVQEGFSKIAVYQDIRAISLILLDEVATFAGAMSGFVLPILYAILGACANVFRELRAAEVQNTYDAKRTETVPTARFIAASIVGISIGLFTTFLKGGAELSPLAIAFVAGYASDEFFNFIERLVKALFPQKE